MLIPSIVLGIFILGVLIYVLTRSSSQLQGTDPMPSDSRDSSSTPRDMAALLEPLRRPAFLVKRAPGESTSYFGGLPPATPGFRWPKRDGRPLAFLACLDLADIGAAVDWLPESGLLLFFYDVEEQPWGFDPEDATGWAVLFVRDPATIDGFVPAPSALNDDWRLDRHPAEFEAASYPPGPGHDDLEALHLSDEEQDALDEYCSSLRGDGPAHQVGGYPDAVQDSAMALQCQLVTHGLYCGNESGYDDPRARELAAGASDWRFLFQIDSDDELGTMWGDMGRIYFWVRAQEAKGGDFSGVWLVLQCH